MDYSNEQLERIEALAAKLTPISDIGVLMELDVDTLRLDIHEKSSQVHRYYHRGKAATAMKLREQELDLAMVGSPLAVQLTASYLTNMDIDEDL